MNKQRLSKSKHILETKWLGSGRANAMNESEKLASDKSPAISRNPTTRVSRLQPSDVQLTSPVPGCNQLKIIKLIKNISVNSEKITTNKYFMKLYTNIKNILKNKLKKSDIQIKEIKDTPNKYLKDNEFTSDKIKHNIVNNLKYCYEITSNHPNATESKDIIIYFRKKPLNYSKIIPKNIIQMLSIIKLLKTLFKRNNIQKIIYFETDEKKKFPKSQNIPLGPNEVNSGLTFLDPHVNGDIILYRKEEVIKVLIHELIHSNLIDEKIIFSNHINASFNNLFCTDYKILLNEAFTETLATIINIFYINIINNLQKRELNGMFNNELKYSKYICAKILRYYNIDKISDVIKNNNICKLKFPQKTNVFSYYILKNILLTKHLDFGNILFKSNQMTETKNNYKINNEKEIKEIIKLIVDNIKLLDDNKNIIENSDKNNSLRMCIY